MSSHGHVFHSPKVVSVLTRQNPLGQLLLTLLALGIVLWLTLGAYSARSNEMLTPARDQISPPAGMQWPSSGLEAQIVVQSAPIKINVEAFNKKREKDIADASRKLVSLAIALKSEVDSNSENKLSAIQKAKEIEKLAKRVKDEMTLNPIPL